MTYLDADGYAWRNVFKFLYLMQGVSFRLFNDCLSAGRCLTAL